MSEYLNTPTFGFVISVLAFQFGLFINRKTRKAIFNPLVIAIILIISFLSLFNIDYEVYNKGGSIISFFLGPATVMLAIPLYKNIEKLKENGVSILIGILAGSITSIVSIIFLSRIFGLNDILMKSLIPKSTTSAISQEIAAQLGGISSLAMAGTIVAGISGNLMGPYILKLFGVRDRVAIGTALGTSSHAVGTAKAMELGEIEGGMSSLAISVAGLLTVFLAPLILRILST